MKKIYRLICHFVLFTLPGFAQPYGNEWINYNQSYYKFKIKDNGIYRISKGTLDAIGVPGSVTGGQFRIYRDGNEIPVYVSNNAAFGAADYLEFYGEKIDGKPDTRLYKDPNWQPTDKQSLFNDSAVYFLTWSNAAAGLKYNLASNVINNPPAAVPYCWTETGTYGTVGDVGKAYAVPGTSGSYMASAMYDEGEGFYRLYAGTTPANTASITSSLSITDAYTGGPNPKVSYSFRGGNNGSHRTTMLFNNNQVLDKTHEDFSMLKGEVEVDKNWLTSTNSFVYKPVYQNASEYIIDFATRLIYPRGYNFNGLSGYYFETDPFIGASAYFEINGFQRNSVKPRLYDIKNRQIYEADTVINNVLRYQFGNSNQSGAYYVSSVNTSIPSSAITPVTLGNYTQTGKQGNYVIITHPDLMAQSSAIQDYRNYRSSTNGGGYTVTVASAKELYDEFAFGYDMNPLGVKGFLEYAYDNWTVKPANLFIIGKPTTYRNYKTYRQSPQTYPYPIVPTYGDWSSDYLFADFNMDGVPELPVGRLSVFNATDIANYLAKVKEYESFNKFNYDDVKWKKRVLFAAGASGGLQDYILVQFKASSDIAVDTPWGASVTTIAKNSTDYIQVADPAIVDSVINNGVGVISFFGHSSQQNLDYNLDNPSTYQNKGKYFLMTALGCSVGNTFGLNTIRNLTEQMLAEPDKAAIGFWAQSTTGWSNLLGPYQVGMYDILAKTRYGRTMGDQYTNTIAKMATSFPGSDAMRINSEQIVLYADPVLSLYQPAKPDYTARPNDIYITPGIVYASDNQFKLKVVLSNLGRAIADSVPLRIRMRNGSNERNLFNGKVGRIAFNDTLNLVVNINKSIDPGENIIELLIDENNVIPEENETNNTISTRLLIYSDDVKPFYPSNFSFVDDVSNISLYAACVNPFLTGRQYWMELDTTPDFNSTQYRKQLFDFNGGFIKWTVPGLQNNRVYYWRVKKTTVGNDSVSQVFSFTGLPGKGEGWNQSHWGQVTMNSLTGYDVTMSNFAFFEKVPQKINLRAALGGIYTDGERRVILNDTLFYTFGCTFGIFDYFVFDTLGLPWRNHQVGGGGRYNSNYPCRDPLNQPAFEYSYSNAPARNLATIFLDSIPAGFTVYMMNISTKNAAHIGPSQWKNDSVTYGVQGSLYHRLRDAGITQIDSFNRLRPVIFSFVVGKPQTAAQYYGDSLELLNRTFNFQMTSDEGVAVTDLIGPARSWNKIVYDGVSLENPSKDSVTISVYGVDYNNNTTLLQKLYGLTNDVDISAVSAQNYPYLKLQLDMKDDTLRSAYQMGYWRVLYETLPDAALNPSKLLVKTDSLSQGQGGTFKTVVENVTHKDMDSLLVQYTITDKNNNKHNTLKKYGPLKANDTLQVGMDLNSTLYPGNNVFTIDVNPAFAQPELTRINNVGVLPLYVRPDQTNPLMDVTFDGVHIMNGDIVSAKPFIFVKLKDDNKYLLLNDTSVMTVGLRKVGGDSVMRVPFDNSTLKFYPAGQGKAGANEASIEYTPNFTEDGMYELIVSGKDKLNNTIGKTAYRIQFEVINKAMISNLLNYPNPFTSATQFVFTLTGSQIPSNLKIQVLTVTGKVVREITKQELGPIHIGLNRTDFRWDGTDQYGQALGNGVYLYRVVANLNGSAMDKFDRGNLKSTDKYFKQGFGKMYLLR